MKINNRQRRRPMSEINVVPYIDVMLVLLVIFMITAPLLNQGVNVQLPQTQARNISTQKDPIVVSVDAHGLYYLNIATQPQQSLTADIIAQQVASSLKTDTSRSVLIKGDRDVDYGKVVSMMAVLQQAGVNNVGLVTNPDGAK